MEQNKKRLNSSCLNALDRAIVARDLNKVLTLVESGHKIARFESLMEILHWGTLPYGKQYHIFHSVIPFGKRTQAAIWFETHKPNYGGTYGYRCGVLISSLHPLIQVHIASEKISENRRTK